MFVFFKSGEHVLVILKIGNPCLLAEGCCEDK